MNNIKKQSGATLIVALIILTVMTMLGVSSIKSSTTSLKMASNDRASFNNFQAAYSSIDRARVDLTQLNLASPQIYTYKVGTKSDGSALIVTVRADLSAGGNVKGVLKEDINAVFSRREITVTATAAGASSSIQIQGLLSPVAGEL